MSVCRLDNSVYNTPASFVGVKGRVVRLNKSRPICTSNWAMGLTDGRLSDAEFVGSL